jgi:hypothetical protein
MRYLTLKINPSTELTLDNTIWGKETVKLNGVVVSEKTSIWGSEHNFEALEENKMVTYNVIIKMGFDIKISYLITRDGEELLNDTKEPVKGIHVRNWVKSLAILIWIASMLLTLRNDASLAIPLALLPILLSSSNSSNFDRNIDLTISK